MITEHSKRSGLDWFARHGPLEESRRWWDGGSGEYKDLIRLRPRPLTRCFPRVNVKKKVVNFTGTKTDSEL